MELDQCSGNITGLPTLVALLTSECQPQHQSAFTDCKASPASALSRWWTANLQPYEAAVRYVIPELGRAIFLCPPWMLMRVHCCAGGSFEPIERHTRKQMEVEGQN